MARFTIRSSGEILPRRRQPQSVHRASYESSGSYSTTSIVSPLQSGQKVGRKNIATSEREPVYVSAPPRNDTAPVGLTVHQ
jgi:hypothetical protein